ncbi:MAG TPA: oxygen-independent coproporphyrinogen III oxidase [Lachnospiraceae bacterium]|nr:oxygen-independent coproporphyrinogen III oxidase [Lachnospiraceae bacterium]
MELYIHIPFCVKKCAYCDFLSFGSDQDDRRRYALALIQELKYWGQQLDHPQVETVFIGGGTPSWMEPQYLAEIIATAREEFHILPDCEFTMEMNPGTVTQESLGIYLRSGVNRLSIGLQSSIDSELQTLGRIHDYNQFLRSYEKAMDAGFTNINIDIMTGIPGQNLKSLEKTLRNVTGLHPKHISAYDLMIEEGTPFYEKYCFDEVKRHAGMPTEFLPDEETQYQMTRLTEEFLESKGYHQYEISNFAKDGKECIHNIGYWKRVPYLGVGLGAASLVDEVRYSNERNLLKYIERLESDESPRVEEIELSKRDAISEYMYLGLRMNEGINRRDFYETFGNTVEGLYDKVIKKNEKLGLLKVAEGRIFLTEKGMDVANRVMAEFLLD